MQTFTTEAQRHGVFKGLKASDVLNAPRDFSLGAFAYLGFIRKESNPVILNAVKNQRPCGSVYL